MLNNFEPKFTIKTCYSNINQTLGQNANVKPSYNPFALGSRWLVFADSRVRFSSFLSIPIANHYYFSFMLCSTASVVCQMKSNNLTRQLF